MRALRCGLFVLVGIGIGCGPGPRAPAASPSVMTPAPATESAPSYEALAIKAEAGEPVDLRELRMAYLRSAAFRSGARDGGEAVRVRIGEMFKAMRSKDHAKVFALAQQTIAEGICERGAAIRYGRRYRRR